MQSHPVSKRMISAEEFAGLGAPKTVYIRELGAAEIAGLDGLPDTLKNEAGLKLYAVHLIDGTRVAVVDNREAAFAAARQHKMEPVSVH